MLKGNSVVGKSVPAERMNIGVIFFGPVPKFDPQLEGCLGFPHELFFVEPYDLVEPMNRGNRGFPHPNRAYVVRFDESDSTWLSVDGFGQCRGGHPARGTSSENDDFFNALVHRTMRLLLIRVGGHFARGTADVAPIRIYTSALPAHWAPQCHAHRSNH